MRLHKTTMETHGCLSVFHILTLQSKVLKCIKFAHVLKSTFSIARQNCLKFIDYFRRVPCNSFATLRSLCVSCLFFFPNLALFLNFLSSPLHYTGHSNKLIGYFIGAPHIIHNCRNVRAGTFRCFSSGFFQSQQQGVVDSAATATDCVTTIIARSS